MITFQEMHENVLQNLNEALITLGRKPYPKFGNVVIMAGGAGSGKGFIKDKLVAVNGYNFDVDELKKLVGKASGIKAKVKSELGYDLDKISSNLKDPKNVSDLHHIISTELNIDDRKKQAFLASAMSAHPDRKPNIIFDVTLSTLSKLSTISKEVTNVGYRPENIHIVWIINDITIAQKQNQERDRVVPAEILLNTHKGVSTTMQDILSMGKTLTNYMDGDIVFAFNKVFVDSEVTMSDKKPSSVFNTKKDSKGLFIKKANYFYVKRAGKPVTSLAELDKDIKAKIRSYVPDYIGW